MKILALSDEENTSLWEYYRKGKLDGYDLIISCGDLKADYLSFLVTMANRPLLYVHGNHDADYLRHPPEGCDCIDDHFVVYNGLRILGLGGSMRYRSGPFQYTEKQMRKRIRRLRYLLWKHKGVDLVVTHCPPKGLGDQEDYAHRGSEALIELMDKYHPQYLLHGHVHLNYGPARQRIYEYGNTKIINAFDRYTLEIEDRPVARERDRNQLLYKTRQPKILD